ncbi:hypothetical protein ACSRUE_37860 [Sorangium sp. KYC3313]|uniref:hypothetical protein n=1 Tax=Sorangium sp. KYC3313 TaxID=3449740 RepID=UPI003F8A9272
MNFLESLAGRARETVAVVEPPRVPFVNVFPDGGLGVQNDEGVRRAAPGIAIERPPSEPTLPRAARSAGREEQAVAAAPAEPRSMDVRLRGSPAAPAPVPAPSEPRAPRVERVIEQHVVRAEHDGRERAGIAPLLPAREEEPRIVREERWLREVHETEQHVTERRTERVVERATAPVKVPPIMAAPAPPPRGARPELAPSPRPAPVPLPPGPSRRALQEEAAAPTGPAAPPPPVHVSIGRIVVRVQAPPVASRTEVTRPAPPALGLEAYTAGQRRGERR